MNFGFKVVVPGKRFDEENEYDSSNESLSTVFILINTHTPDLKIKPTIMHTIWSFYHVHYMII